MARPRHRQDRQDHYIGDPARLDGSVNADTGTSIRFVNRLTHHVVTPCVGRRGGCVTAPIPYLSVPPRGRLTPRPGESTKVSPSPRTPSSASAPRIASQLPDHHPAGAGPRHHQPGLRGTRLTVNRKSGRHPARIHGRMKRFRVMCARCVLVPSRYGPPAPGITRTASF